MRDHGPHGSPTHRVIGCHQLKSGHPADSPFPKWQMRISNEKWKIFSLYQVFCSSPPEAVTVFTRSDKRLDHLRLLEVAAKMVQLLQPKLVATVIRITTQVAEVFHHDKRFVPLGGHE